jgi:hypothetical protein
MELAGGDHWWWVGHTDPIIKNINNFLYELAAEQ